MTKKTIAFITIGLNSGGAERVVSTLSNELTKSYNVVIITLKTTPIFYPLDPNIKVVHCADVLKPSKNSFDAIKSNYKLYKEIKKQLRHHHADLCIGFVTTPNILATLASRSLGIPVIISERNNPFMEDVKLSKFWKILRRFVYPRADFTVVQTELIQSFFARNIDSRRLKIIPNPINPDFDSGITIPKENIVLNVGRLSDQKAQDTLIRSFANLDAPDWQLHIAGEGENREKLENLIEELNVKDRVFLLGRTDAIQSLYQKSKIFAFTSLYEGFPNALMEGLYFGLACVSTDCPSGPSELIENNKNGILIPVGGQAELEKSLQGLIDDPMARERLGKAARKTMESYDSESITKEWLGLIQNLIKLRND